jgi:oligopeptide/dipeptide ABC transporter ATP-binding protein
MGLIEPPAGQIVTGRIMFKGRNHSELDDDELQAVRGGQIAMIFQDLMTALNPVYIIGDQLMETILLHQDVNRAEAREIAHQAIDDVDIPNAKAQLLDYPHQYSGGMRQRIMIAMGLSCNPDLLIADEPTTALEVTTQAQIMDLMLQLAEDRGTAVMLITHDLSVVRHISDRVAVMYLGKMVEMADRASLYDRPMHPYTHALMSAVPIPDPHVESKRERILLEGDIPSPANPPPGCRFNTRCPQAEAGTCDVDEPEFRELEPGHWVACHFPEVQQVY